MPHLNTPRLASFPRLIALGYPPVLAARAAGYRNLRASRAATRLPQLPAVVGAERPRAAAAKPVTRAAETPPPPRPPFEPMMTEEEWVAKYDPRRREPAGASA